MLVQYGAMIGKEDDKKESPLQLAIADRDKRPKAFLGLIGRNLPVFRGYFTYNSSDGVIQRRVFFLSAYKRSISHTAPTVLDKLFHNVIWDEKLLHLIMDFEAPLELIREGSIQEKRS
jgi:hypothetical protein